MKPFRSKLQMIFQDPYYSLNPRMTVRNIIGEPLMVFGQARGSQLDDQVEQLMLKVGLRPEYMARYPHAFSGGQRQRIGIARALALRPQLLICDEAVSSLDVSVQAQILGLLEDLQQEFGMSYLFIAHDLSAVKHISDQVIVMYVGKIVEIADSMELYANPRHPYTEALLGSVPRMDVEKGTPRENLQGEVPDPSKPPQGCYFHPRCRYKTPECEYCTMELHDVSSPGGAPHLTACIHGRELSLRGV
jgi:peptide/nickel transport system ATP-binding protein